ncbi:hypothetical protein CLV86_0530 [Lacinutrix venerupis]|uniref:hypothetical protein n=1 Tax=Lacinutrix venerupis TaxID=1486034 RepID=UPI000EB492C2|nr:hypothetical protein [Lacinutrix venerupis]RLJ69136.1 hypothetical protein CLV86_0530 [Lacinutrix venerupis]
MKTLFKQALVVLVVLTLFNCNNDDDDAPNVDVCNYQGMSYLDTSDNTQILIPEADLTTDYFASSSNGPEWEIYGNTQGGDFLTLVYSPGTNTYEFIYNGTQYPVTITVQRDDNVLGGEIRCDVSHSGFEIEYCVIIDVYH